MDRSRHHAGVKKAKKRPSNERACSIAVFTSSAGSLFRQLLVARWVNASALALTSYSRLSSVSCLDSLLSAQQRQLIPLGQEAAPPP